MEMAVRFREGHCSLSGKIMSTIFHSIKLLHLAQLATHTKVKEKDLFLYDREGWCMCTRKQARKATRKTASIHNPPSFQTPTYLFEHKCIDEGM